MSRLPANVPPVVSMLPSTLAALVLVNVTLPPPLVMAPLAPKLVAPVPLVMDTAVLVVAIAPLTATALLPLVSVKPPGVVTAPSAAMLLADVPRFNALVAPVSVAESVAALTMPVWVTEPPAARVKPPETAEVPNASALASLIATLLPVTTDTAPVKSLPVLVRVTSLTAPAVMAVAPLTTSAVEASWLTAPLAPTVRLPVPTVPVVVILPSVLAPVPVIATLPPLVASEPAAEKVVAPAALRLTFSALLLLETVLLTRMLPAAVKVSVAAAPADLVMESATVMLPAWVPVAPVLMVTLVPPFSAVCIVLRSATALSAVGVKTFAA
jgi:hypothetical protein